MTTQRKVKIIQHSLLLLFFFAVCRYSIAEPPVSRTDTTIAFEIGVLSFIGTDLRISYHEANSPWTMGLRHLDIDDDFINESAVGFPGDQTDRQLTARNGIYINYQFSDYAAYDSYYVSAALYDTTVTVKCGGESDSDSATGIYFGGGYQKMFSDRLGYRIGLLFSPFVSLQNTTTLCTSEGSGDFDIDMSLTVRF